MSSSSNNWQTQSIVIVLTMVNARFGRRKEEPQTLIDSQ
jgi:hypothetical protein